MIPKPALPPLHILLMITLQVMQIGFLITNWVNTQHDRTAIVRLTGEINGMQRTINAMEHDAVATATKKIYGEYLDRIKTQGEKGLIP